MSEAWDLSTDAPSSRYARRLRELRITARAPGDASPAAAAGAISQQPTILPQTTIVYPSTVIDAKNELDPVFATLAKDVAACAALSDVQKAAFASMYASWRKFFCRNDTGQCAGPDYSIFGLGSQLDEVESYQQRIFDWQAALTQAKCSQSQPTISPPGAPTAPAPAALKWIALLGGLGLTAYVLHESGVLRRLHKGR